MDSCLWLRDDCIFISYVDDGIFLGNDKAVIDACIENMQSDILDKDNTVLERGLDLEIMSDLSSYLGVQIDRLSDGQLKLSQPGLTKATIQCLGLDEAHPKATPCAYPLGSAKKEAKFNDAFNYRSAIGMLMYLGNNTRLDCAFSINQCARFSADPRACHGEAAKRIGRYLASSATQGFLINPDRSNLSLDCFVDSDFAGLWGYEDDQDPVSTRSRTGFIVTLGRVPVTWVSKLQTETSLSTMEAEYVALSTAMRTLLPLRRKLTAMCKALKLKVDQKSLLSTVWEDNQAAQNLATADPPRLTPRSKHLAIKYHWFRSKLKIGRIEVKHIASEDNLADILTKPLSREVFERLRKRIMGW
jgi:hypothetical protein